MRYSMQTVYICLITHNTLIHTYILLSFTSIYPARGMYSMSTLVGICDSFGQTPVMWAVENGEVEVLKLLISNYL